MAQVSDRTLYLAVIGLVVVTVGLFAAPLLLFGSSATGDPGSQSVPANPGPANPGPADPGPANTGPANPGPANPGTAGMPPSFVAPGARLTWYAAGASVAGSRYSWVEEPCTGQNWSDPKTGKCYRRTDESGEGQPGASGDGLSQLDIVAVEGANAVLASNLYTFFRENNTLIWTPLGGGSVNAVNVDGAWVNPAELAQLVQTGLGDMLVLRGTYRAGMNSYEAVSFVNGLGTSSYSSYTYDLASGLLLSANTSSGGVTSPIRAQGEDPPVGNTQLTLARFAGYRQRNVPGLNAPKPDWVAGTSQLTYQGTYNFTNPVDPTSANLTYPAQFAATFTGQGGSTWSPFTARTTVPQLGLDNSSASVAGPNGALWFDPQSLAAMSGGQVIDQDGLTGEQVSVVGVGPGAQGQPTVTIENRVPGNLLRSTYDQQSGMLLGFDLQQASAGTTISVQLVDRR